VKRVYLDQWVWIALARAFHNDAPAKEEAEVLALAQSAVSLRLASFPLSWFHYFENYMARDPSKRRRLTEVMEDVSKFHTIAPENILLPSELDAALFRRFGRPVDRRKQDVFGVGVAHAFGEPDGVPPASFRRHVLADELVRLWEFFSLAGPQPEIVGANSLEMESWKKPAVDFAEAQVRFAGQLDELEFGRDKRKDAVAAQELAQLLEEALRPAMARAGIPEEALFEGGQDALTAFLEDVPMRNVAFQLRLFRHSMPQKKWTRTDLADIGALAVAVPNCDAVATEAVWVDGLRRACLDEKYSTRLMRSLSELRTFLATLT
jgi:hypothetical protein